MSAWEYEGSPLQSAARLLGREWSLTSYIQARRMDTEKRAWREAAAIILGGPHSAEDVTYALIAWRGHLIAGHPVLKLLEAHREYLRGERSRLTDEELAPLRERAA